MKNRGTVSGMVVCLCLLLTLCTPKVETDLPVIDVIGAMKMEKPLMLSELVEYIEYVKLETSPECLIGNGSVLKVGNNLYVKSFNPSVMLVFDGQGKFLKQISRPGKGPGEYKNCPYFDVSQDNKYVAISGPEDGIKLYTTEGEFKAHAKISNQFFSGFFFLSPEKLLTYPARMNISQRGFPVMVVWDIEELQPDTLLSIDRETQPSDMMITMAHSACYPFGGNIYFKEAGHDTLFQLDSKMKISPRVVFNCGDKAVTEENLFISSNQFTVPVSPVCETRDYLFIHAGKGDAYGTLAHHKKTGETFRMPVKESRLYEKAKTYGPENDLEGIDFSFNGIRVKDKIWTSIFQVSDLKPFFDRVNPDQLDLMTRKYFDELRRLVESSDVNDNPVVRIMHLK